MYSHTCQRPGPTHRVQVFFDAESLPVRGQGDISRTGKTAHFILKLKEREDPLNGFLEWCKKGPMGSKVEEVTTEEGEIKNYTSFDIK